MAHQKDFIGRKHGYLTICALAKYRETCFYVECKCFCGNTITCLLESLERDKVRSCGCLTDRNSITFKEHFHKRITSSLDKIDDCWIWKGLFRLKNGTEYPYINHMGIQSSPLKYFYELSGNILPKNYMTSCICCNKLCVNPEHHIITDRKGFKIKKE